MKFVLLTIASAEEQWSNEAFDLYTEKISHFMDFEIINLKHKKISRNSSTEKIKSDSEAILANLKDDDFVVLMDEKGKSFDSIQFSKKIENILLSGKKRCVWIIGGAFGVDETIKKRAQLVISMSTFVFNHLVAQVVLMEQIYRSFTIIKNTPYHNK